MINPARIGLKLTLPIMSIRMEDNNHTFEITLLALNEENITLGSISGFLLSSEKLEKPF